MPRRKRVWRGALIVAFVAAVPCAAQAQGQPAATTMPEMKKWDASGAIGWHTRPLEGLNYTGRINSLSAGVSLGRYWTENVKTEVSIGTPGTIEVPGWTSRSLQGIPLPPGNGVRVDERISGFQVGITQIYQFFHNQDLHPFVGGGVLIGRQRVDLTQPEQRIYYGPPGAVLPAAFQSTSAWRAFGFVEAGVKAYISYHAFFRADTRLAMNRGSYATNARVGLGVDF